MFVLLADADNVFAGIETMSGTGATIRDCRVLELPRIASPEGQMTTLEDKSVPFEVARVFYVYDIPGGAARGGHAHWDLEQVIVCVMGSFTVELDDGTSRESVRLDRAYRGLYVPPLIWREMRDFSSGDRKSTRLNSSH